MECSRAVFHLAAIASCCPDSEVRAFSPRRRQTARSLYWSAHSRQTQQESQRSSHYSAFHFSFSPKIPLYMSRARIITPAVISRMMETNRQTVKPSHGADPLSRRVDGSTSDAALMTSNTFHPLSVSAL